MGQNLDENDVLHIRSKSKETDKGRELFAALEMNRDSLELFKVSGPVALEPDRVGERDRQVLAFVVDRQLRDVALLRHWRQQSSSETTRFALLTCF